MIVVQYKMSTLLENIHSICIKTKGVIGILDLHINYGGGGGGGELDVEIDMISLL